ncbi:endonuclease/exonuclease/phosphatase family protein [Algoriphagus namhaensis]
MIWALRFFSLAFILFSIVPWVRWRYWWIRVFDYPKLQKLSIILLCLVLWILQWDGFQNLEPNVWILILGVTAVHLTAQAIPFSPMGKKMIQSGEYDPNKGLSVLVSNVYQPNDDFDKLLKLIKKVDADVVLLVETDQKWMEALHSLQKNYPFQILIPKDNTYGMLFYSKLEIQREEIHYLIDPEIPSIEVDLILPNKELVTLYGIHPTPPVPPENDESTDRDAEILIVGRKAKKNPLPSLVIGDLNDVAWSDTTELFLRTSGLTDPRRGRGFYNTFNAKMPLLRWPLDHIFLSPAFCLGGMEVLPSIGSDHFPISLKAHLARSVESDTFEQENGDQERVEETIEEAKEQNE